MLKNLIKFSLSERFLLVVSALVIAGWGFYCYQRLPIDAFPDISNTQVQVIVKASGMTPGSRATGNESDRNRGQRDREPDRFAFDEQVRFVGDYHRFRGWHGHLLGQAASFGTHRPCIGGVA